MQKKLTINKDTSKRHKNKYENKNIIHKMTLCRFFDAVAKDIETLSPESTLDFGCGEGLFIQELKKRGLLFKKLTGIDMRQDALDYAKTILPEYTFIKTDIMSWTQKNNSFDLVIASQVLEHLYDAHKILKQLIYFSNRYIYVTVPWEPWFRIMNLLRGRDIRRLGNHPEHVNNWSKNQIKTLISKYAVVKNHYCIFPFTIILAEVK